MCGAAIAGAGGYGDPVSGYELQVAEEGGTLTKDQMIDNWALGGGDEPDWGFGPVRMYTPSSSEGIVPSTIS